MSIDLNRANILLDVVHKVAAAGPGYNNLLSFAGTELKAMDDEAGKEIAKAKAEADKKAAEEIAKADAEEAAKAKAEEAKTKVLEPAERKI